MSPLQPAYNGTTTRYSSMEEDIAAAKAAGFRGLEIKRWKLDDYLQKNSLASLRSMVNDSGLTLPTLGPYDMIVCGTPEQRRASLEKLRQHAEMAAFLAVPGVVASFDEPRKAVGVTGPQKTLEPFIEAASECAEILGRCGVLLGLETLGGQRIVRGPGEGMEIVRRCRRSNMRIVFDTFHFFRNQVTRGEILSLPQEMILVAHVSDCDPLPLEELEDTHRLYPGLGVIPLKELLAPIVRQGYDRYISVEAPRVEYWQTPVDKVCPVALSHLRELIGQLAASE